MEIWNECPGFEFWEQHNQGFSTQHPLTVVLLSLCAADSQSSKNGTLHKVTVQIKELRASIEMSSSMCKPQNYLSAPEMLSEEIDAPMLRAVKPGINLSYRL